MLSLKAAQWLPTSVQLKHPEAVQLLPPHQGTVGGGGAPSSRLSALRDNMTDFNDVKWVAGSALRRLETAEMRKGVRELRGHLQQVHEAIKKRHLSDADELHEREVEAAPSIGADDGISITSEEENTYCREALHDHADSATGPQDNLSR